MIILIIMPLINGMINGFSSPGKTQEMNVKQELRRMNFDKLNILFLDSSLYMSQCWEQRSVSGQDFSFIESITLTTTCDSIKQVQRRWIHCWMLQILSSWCMYRKFYILITVLDNWLPWKLTQQESSQPDELIMCPADWWFVSSVSCSWKTQEVSL